MSGSTRISKARVRKMDGGATEAISQPENAIEYIQTMETGEDAHAIPKAPQWKRVKTLAWNEVARKVHLTRQGKQSRSEVVSNTDTTKDGNPLQVGWRAGNAEVKLGRSLNKISVPSRVSASFRVDEFMYFLSRPRRCILLGVLNNLRHGCLKLQLIISIGADGVAWLPCRNYGCFRCSPPCRFNNGRIPSLSIQVLSGVDSLLSPHVDAWSKPRIFLLDREDYVVSLFFQFEN